MEESVQKNQWAAPALALGIVSVFFAWVFVPPILAIVFGAMGLSRATALSNDKVAKTGKGFSITGLVLGGVYLFVAFYQLVA
jgi:hypothetical protein